VLIAVVIAPALARAAGPLSGLDYMTYGAIGTAALVVPLSCMQAGLGVIVDRKSGARPDLLTAAIPHPLIVLANLAAALATSGLQLAALLAFSACAARPSTSSRLDLGGSGPLLSGWPSPLTVSPRPSRTASVRKRNTST
jgi:hypothetical protein